MRGLDPRIQAHSDPPIWLDGRVKPGHDAPYLLDDTPLHPC